MTMSASPDPVPGFWVHLDEPEARALANGQVHDAVRYRVASMLEDYDAHLRAAAKQLASRKDGSP
jgi:hypothetical protein